MTMGEQSYGTRLSQETKLKIDEFKILLNKYPQYCPNADGVNSLYTIPLTVTTHFLMISWNNFVPLTED
jgi:hypothetical protein